VTAFVSQIFFWPGLGVWSTM